MHKTQSKGNAAPLFKEKKTSRLCFSLDWQRRRLLKKLLPNWVLSVMMYHSLDTLPEVNKWHQPSLLVDAV